jgi:hypothetical protein
MTSTDAIVVLSLVAVLVLWFIGEWTYTHWYGILRWRAGRRASRRLRQYAESHSANPYTFCRGFMWGAIVGAGIVGLAWRI